MSYEFKAPNGAFVYVAAGQGKYAGHALISMRNGAFIPASEAPALCRAIMEAAGQSNPADPRMQAENERQERLRVQMVQDAIWVGKLMAENARQTRRIQKHRRIITRLLAERRAINEVLVAPWVTKLFARQERLGKESPRYLGRVIRGAIRRSARIIGHDGEQA